MTSEYKGWEDYVDRIRRNKHYNQIKKEWKGAVNDYFGYDKYFLSNLEERSDCNHHGLKKKLKPLIEANVIGRIEALEDFRRNHSGEFHVGKDLGHIYASKAIDELQKQVRELEDNQHKHGHTEILLRVEKLEDNFDTCKSLLKEVETKYEHLKIRDDVLKDDLEELKEWQRSHEHKLHACDGDKKKVIDKSAWNEIREFLTHVTGQESKGLLRYDMVHSITGHPVSFDWIKKINKLVEEQDK